MKSMEYYHFFAQLFAYPGKTVEEAWKGLHEAVDDILPTQSKKVNRLEEAFGSMTFDHRQEYYLKTFDVQAVCFLDIGYVLFGEDYKRAQLLVNLQAEHQKAGIDCGTELADHLPNVLKLLSVTEDLDFTNELGFVILIPAIRFMILKFGETENYYKSLLELLLEFLYLDFNGDGLSEYLIPEQNFTAGRDFLLDSPKSVLCETMCYHRKKS